MGETWVLDDEREIVLLEYVTSEGPVLREKPAFEVESGKHELAHTHLIGYNLKDVNIKDRSRTRLFSLEEQTECYNDALIERVRLEFREDGSIRMYGLEGTITDERFNNPEKFNREHFFFRGNEPAEFLGRYTKQTVWPSRRPVSINDEILEEVYDFLLKHHLPEEETADALSLLDEPGPKYEEEHAKNHYFIL